MYHVKKKSEKKRTLGGLFISRLHRVEKQARPTSTHSSRVSVMTQSLSASQTQGNCFGEAQYTSYGTYSAH
jgi:hypothetical protein